MMPSLPKMMPKEKQASATPEELVEGNLRLVAKIADAYAWNETIRQDIFQEGVRGLMRAAEKFDPYRGASFGTYASYWIKQAIRRYLHYNRTDIRVPVHHNHHKYKAITEKFAYDALYNITSLQACENEDGECWLQIPEIKEEEVYSNNYLAKELNKVMHFLDKREQDIIIKRFGLNGVDSMTLDELGVVYNLTRERIRQIQNEALKKLKFRLSRLEKQLQ